ncbi:MAG: DUF484 family protein [Acetobacteraceae bacterium]
MSRSREPAQTSDDRPRPRRRQAGGVSDEDAALSVEAFLRAHPDFLARRPGLYAALAPPARVHGERLADHMAAMLVAERTRTAKLAAWQEAMLAAERSAAALHSRAQRAVLALMPSRTPAEALDIVQQEWPPLLGIDVVSVCAEARSVPLARPLPRGFVARTLARGATVTLRAQADDTDTLYGEAAPLVASDALARLPLARGGPALIACGVRDPGHYAPGQATEAIAFLAAAAAIALSRTL